MKVKLKPAPGDPKLVARLIGELDSPRFELRKQASEELARQGPVAEPALKQALADKPSLELRTRVEQLLKKLEAGRAERTRDLRALEVLEHVATPEARQHWRSSSAAIPTPT